MLNQKLKIAVLMGGISRERQVSLQSGRMIAGALEEAGLNVVPADICPDDLGVLEDSSIDVFFPALHGQFGEDGKLQGILEEKNLCYVGSGPAASELAMDKIACKETLAEQGVRIPEHIAVCTDDTVETVTEKISRLGEVVVVKPVEDGSSFGVQIIGTAAGAAQAAIETFEQFGNCMVEEFIAGREITVGILDGEALPIIEIRSKTQFYDYHAKYVDDGTEYLFDTIEDKELREQIKKMAQLCFNFIGCRHLGRVDMILGDDGGVYFLEVNTLPGFTSHSLLPKAANKAGISNSQLCVGIIEAAMGTFAQKE